MNNSIKSGLLSGALFGLMMGSIKFITDGLLNGIIAGIIMGFLFGIAIGIFVQVQSKKFKKDGQNIVGNNNIVFDGSANHFNGNEAVGGWLYLTDDELIFKSHNYNIQTHKLVISLNNIIDVKTSLTHGYFPNGLQVITNDNIEKFVVFKRKEWVRTIKAAIKAAIKNSIT